MLQLTLGCSSWLFLNFKVKGYLENDFFVFWKPLIQYDVAVDLFNRKAFIQ
jgi:hypothetical protein